MASEASLARIASPPLDYRPPLRVDAGTVAVVLKNGAPIQVVRPGKSMRRLVGGLPMSGQLKYVAVSTEEIRVRIEVRDIAIRGVFPLEAVTLKVGLTLNQDGEFAALKAYIARRGLNFAELLADDVQANLDRMVRKRVESHDADEIWATRVGLEPEQYLRELLVDGLFEISTVALAEPTFSQKYRDHREIDQDAAVEAKQIAAEITKTPLQLELDRMRDLIAQENASRRGLTLSESENPALIEANLQRNHELRLAMVDQLAELRRAGGAAAVERFFMEAARQGELQSSPAAEAPQAPAMLRPMVADARLVEVWEQADLPWTPLGLVRGESEVLAVLGDALDAGSSERIASVFV
ncbi:MAG: hypothetical protein EON59_09180, partial [Alphaproteobacteria bacterium]